MDNGKRLYRFFGTAAVSFPSGFDPSADSFVVGAIKRRVRRSRIDCNNRSEQRTRVFRKRDRFKVGKAGKILRAMRRMTCAGRDAREVPFVQNMQLSGQREGQRFIPVSVRRFLQPIQLVLAKVALQNQRSADRRKAFENVKQKIECYKAEL